MKTLLLSLLFVSSAATAFAATRSEMETARDKAIAAKNEVPETKLALLEIFGVTDFARDLAIAAGLISADPAMGDAAFAIGDNYRSTGQSQYAAGCGKIAIADQYFAAAELLRNESFFTAAIAKYYVAEVGYVSACSDEFMSVEIYWWLAWENFSLAITWYEMGPPPLQE